MQGYEDLTITEIVQAESGFVILGEAFGVEYAPVARGCQTFQRRPVEAGTHAIGRQEAAQALADRNILMLIFRELIAIQAVSQVADSRGQRKHRNLNHLMVVREPVDQAQRIGVNYILGIMRYHRLEANPVLRFKFLHSGVNPI